MSPREIVGQARKLLADGDADECLRLIGYVLDSFSNYYEARLVRALAFEKTARMSDAADDAAFVLGVDPSNATALLLSARIQNQKGDQQQARKLWSRAAEANPDHPDLQNPIDGLDVRSPVTHSFLGYSYLRSGWPELAERQFRAAMESDSVRMDVRLALAESLWSIGRLEDCRRHCRTVLDHHPDCLEALLMMAHVLTEIGRTNHGAELLDRAADLDPEHRVARDLYGRLEFKRMRTVAPASIAPPPAASDGETVHSRDDVRASDVSEPSDATPDELTRNTARADEAQETPISDELPALEIDAQNDSTPVDSDSEPATPEKSVEAPALVDGSHPNADSSDKISGSGAALADSDDRGGAPLSEADQAVGRARDGDWDGAMNLVAAYSAVGDLQTWEHALKTICDQKGAPPLAWEALGDLHMRQSQPQTASEAYGRAIEVRNGLIDDK